MTRNQERQLTVCAGVQVNVFLPLTLGFLMLLNSDEQKSMEKA